MGEEEGQGSGEKVEEMKGKVGMGRVMKRGDGDGFGGALTRRGSYT